MYNVLQLHAACCMLHAACCMLHACMSCILPLRVDQEVLCSSVADPTYCVSMKPQSPRSPSPPSPSLLPKPSKHLHPPTEYEHKPRPEHSAFCFVPFVESPLPFVSVTTLSTPSGT